MPQGGSSLIAHHWRPIANLPDDWEALCRPDLHAIHAEWAAARAALDDPDRVRQVQERLMTVWAIETGIIESLYSVDRGVTIALAEVGLEAMERFHADGQLTAEARDLISDQRASLEMVMDLVGGRRELTDSYIRELHRGLTEHQDTRDAIDAQGRRFAAPLLKGEWKRLPNNPIRPDGRVHEYCP
ncbi:MAG: Fic family protein, partial [Chloroflexi bacterium]|nr:Fic family protein [Chloroflexota bacterium]